MQTLKRRYFFKLIKRYNLLEELDLSKNNEGIFFFPENYLEPEIIEREFDKDPENFINTMGGRFDMVTPKIKDIILEKKKIYQLFM